MSRSRSVADWLTGHPIFGRTMGGLREKPKIKLGEGKVVTHGRAQRMDGSRYTKTSLDARRQERRAKNRIARKARRVNKRGR